MNVNSRAFNRYGCDFPIRFRVEGEKDVMSASLKNYSKGGVGLLTEHPLKEQAILHFAPPVTGKSGSGPIYSSEAKLIWQQAYTDQPSRMGVKWLSQSCNWCNKTVPFRQMYTSGESIFLCNECLEELESNMKGRLKACMLEYLQGNIL